MGIQGLTKLIGDHAPAAIKESEIKNFFGRKIAIDASMSLYQFLIAVMRPESTAGLVDETGETTRYVVESNGCVLTLLPATFKACFIAQSD